MRYQRLGKIWKVKTIAKFSEGIVSTVVDLLLVSIYYRLEFASRLYRKGSYTEAKNGQIFSELTYKSLKRSGRYLEQEGLVNRENVEQVLPQITQKGRKKLDQIIPKYNNERIWDGRIYMITYDIPYKRNAKRNLFRRYLRKVGCAPLQQSVWVTPYNPTSSVKDFVAEHKLESSIVVSSLGKDGTLGERRVSDLLENIYKLAAINKKYKKFIVDTGLGKDDKHKLVFYYLSILKEDPQLPFDLLPDDWLGENATQVFQRIIK